ncbi:MAG: pyridoxine 5'-phosphate synthase [Prolixibacteraceae bacterium]|jgi:pyridoxine 5-phosphate synthase|nr:pyridoxine 5'-phosphate synthase [Prolixibacteraceae bacterium]
MTRLSVNINKIATLRNSRGGTMPSVTEAAIRCQQFGAEGITIHPRPDERHIRYNDARDLKPLVTTEFNIEGYPDPRFIALVLEVLPQQVTLVPDSPSAITSNAGWDTLKHRDFLKEVVGKFQKAGIRVSLFVGTEPEMIDGAAQIGADRVELYTEPYATDFPVNPEKAILPFIKAARTAEKLGLGLNAGHDLSLENLRYFDQHIPNLLEVSIGHALIADALYLGLEKTIELYLECLKKG